MDKIKNIWDKKYNKIMEKRLFEIETRMEEGETVKVVGHASVYNTMSEDLGGFREIIAPGAFDDVLENDVRALINHDGNLILARTTSGTLALSTDEKGLRYEFEMPETSYGKDLAVSMKRGDITQSSFAFTVADDSWETRDGMDVRTINKVKRLFDVSPVTYPAYPDADNLVIAQRGLSVYKEKQEREKEELDLVKRSILNLKIELQKRK
jgi:HK97 family phage prohead protease